MATIELRRWTREEYEKMIQAGVFPPETRAELVDGEIYSMPPQKSSHAAAIGAAEEALRNVFGSGYHLRTQLPLALGPSSEPEPDLAVVSGSWRDYRDAHPSLAVLVMEIADTSLKFDRSRKRRVYAGAAIAEYWIVNLTDRCVEVYRKPAAGAYRLSRRFFPGESITPLAAPQAIIAVSDLLP